MQTYTEIEQDNISFLLDQASRDGEVRILHTDGMVFTLKPEKVKRSALDVAGIDLNLTTQEIVSTIREGRER